MRDVTSGRESRSSNGGRPMKCSSCGFETQSTAKFCVQCGSTLPATGASAAATSTTIIPPAPAVPSSTAAQTSATGVNRAASQTSVSVGSTTVQRSAAAATSASPTMPPVRPTVVGPPADALGPAPTAASRTPIIAGVVAVIALLCVAGYFGYRALFGTDTTSVASTDSAKSEPPAPPPPAKDSSVPATAASDTATPPSAA